MIQASKYLHAPPRAAALVEALRGLGYSPATALADIVDNSITAGAAKVSIQFAWTGRDSSIAIIDDGDGMTAEELLAAMRLGDRNPLQERAQHDLGRFGLGLKTASFSQARRLTVATRKDGRESCLRWDLDVLSSSGDDGWHLLEVAAPESRAYLDRLRDQRAGTIVVWGNLDRLVTPLFGEQDFLDLIDRVERHLAMVFHRFLAQPDPRLRLDINGREVAAWDPFMTSHSATWSSPATALESESGTVVVQCHVLPHKDRLKAEVHADAAGPDGWTAQQGFYVYRNERQLLAGSWLGLGRGRSWTKEEAHRLARIRLDISNSADADWKIDIRKSTARPPVSVRERLTRLAEDTRERARRVFAHRGSVATTAGREPVAQAWRVERLKGGMRYRIDESHPVVAAVLDAAAQLEPQLRAMLRVIEETIPVQRIWLDTAEAKETPRTQFSSAASEEVGAVLSVVYKNMLLRRGLSAEAARHILRATEPFNNFPELVDALPSTC